MERAFLFGEGLPGRPWFKHAVYAPGLTTGYACWPLPAVRQAIEENKSDQIAAAVSKTVERIRQGGGRPQGRHGSRARGLMAEVH